MTDRECLAVITAVKKFQVYILGKGVLIQTDHGAVRQLLQQPESTGRRARWMAILSEFDFSLEHRPGTQHGNADAMSRLLSHQGDALQLDDTSTEIDDSYPTYALRAEVDEDNWYQDIIIYLKGGSLSHLSAAERHKTRTRACKYVLKSRELHHINPFGELKPCISQKEVPSVMEEFHDSAFSGRWGADVTLLGLWRAFYWPTMMRDVMDHVRTCDHCQRFRRDYRTNELWPTWVVEPVDLLYVDWITKLPTTTTGKTAIIVCTAYPSATHWPAPNSCLSTLCVHFVPIRYAHDSGNRQWVSFCRAFSGFPREVACETRFWVAVPPSIARPSGALQRDDHQQAEEVDGALCIIVGHVPSRSYPRSQYPSKQTIEDLPLACLDRAAAQEPTPSFGSPNERRGLHQGLQACGGNPKVGRSTRVAGGFARRGTKNHRCCK